MKALGICPKGFEEEAQRELKEFLQKDSTTENGCILFDVNDNLELSRITYKTQSLQKTMLVLDSFDISENINSDLKKSIEKIDFADWFKDRTFKADCFHIDDNISGMKVAAKIGEYILENNDAKVQMKNPNVIILAYIIDNRCHLGIDFSGIDLSKRDYRIHNHPSALNGGIAFNLLMFSGWSPDKSLLDPMCGSGVIPIEAALLFSKKSAQFFRKENLAFTRFEKFNFVTIDAEVVDNISKNSKVADINCSDHVLACIRATKNNGKIADIDKIIKPTKNDLEWLETKYGEESLDFIVTHPPSMSKHADEKSVIKTFNELFYQAEFVLKEDGKIAIICISDALLEESAEKNGFELIKKKQIMQGKQELTCFLFEKSED